MSEKEQFVKKSTRITHPLSAQLITFISVLVIVALGAITLLVTYFVRSDTQINAEDNNFTVNRRTASETVNKLDSVKSNVFLLLDMVAGESQEDKLSADELSRGGRAASFFFERSTDIASVTVPGMINMVNTQFFEENKIEPTCVKVFLDANENTLSSLKAGKTVLVNAAPVFKRPVLGMFCLVQINGAQKPLAVLFSTESLDDSYGTGTVNSSCMVTDSGDMLLYADVETLKKGKNIAESPAVKSMNADAEENKQLLYTDVDGVRYFGAYTKLAGYGAGVITTVPYVTVFSAVQTSMWRNIFLSIAVLSIAILFVWFWSKTISTPVKQLAESALEIGNGKYDIDFSKIHTRKKSELGILTESFGEMSHGLAEREHLKDAFGKFSNKEIAEKAARGELTLGGETKNVTVFFSDIRSFTAMSEKLQPHEVVAFLNDYMTRMVRCVNATGGVVDKYIGDSIMAVWGSPVSAGSPEQDAFNAVRTAFMMRAALIELNRERKEKGFDPVKIGCGVNSGPVVAGQIGSNERMEYTVIGDAVNLASRTESLNKPLCTDILITENTYLLVKGKVEAVEMPSVTVKGKSEPIKMFALVNIPGCTDIKYTGDKGPSSLDVVRKVMGFGNPDLSKVDVDAEEKKYKIQNQ